MDDVYFLPLNQLQSLIELLQQSGYQTIGPTLQEGTIIYREIREAKELPWGVRDEQAPGRYRIETGAENQAFSWVNGPQGLKPFLFKSRESVWKVERSESGKLEFKPELAPEKPIAFIGARACDLVAVEIQDKTFIRNEYKYESYRQRREQLFVVAVNCSRSSKNCFCVSAGTGPKLQQNFDIGLSELEEGYVVFLGSLKGKELAMQLPLVHASNTQIKLAESGIEKAIAMQTKKIPVDNQGSLRDILFNNLNHPRWDEVAERCLSCGNCTLVCPTCFCHSEHDEPSLDGSSSEHYREWDSCFTAGHSYLSGKLVRDDTRKRYRQWLTHKVGSWFDQFGTSGCVGCGRCITWCPVGIDITEELAAITNESNVRDTSC